MENYIRLIRCILNNRAVNNNKAGKDVGVIAAENLGSLMTAIEGYEMLDDEQKHASRNATDAYVAMKLVDALTAKK